MTAKSGSWNELELEGHLCDVYEPGVPSPHGYTLFYLHGVHLVRLTDNEIFTRQFERHGIRVLAPMTGPSWWSDKQCEEFDSRFSAEQYVLEHVLSHLGRRWGDDLPAPALLGTSMGGQGALRLAFKHPETFPVVAAIAPAIDYHLRLAEGDPVLERMYGDPEAARQDTATLHIHPLNWPRHIFFTCDPTDVPWCESAERLQMKLSALGIPHECDLETEAGGHGFAYYDSMAERAIGFVAERLERERLRIH